MRYLGYQKYRNALCAYVDTISYGISDILPGLDCKVRLAAASSGVGAREELTTLGWAGIRLREFPVHDIVLRVARHEIQVIERHGQSPRRPCRS